MQIDVSYRVDEGTATPEALTLAIRRALFQVGEIVKRRARANLSGRVLRRQTGVLANSVTAAVSPSGTAVVIGTNTFYGRIHEFGAPGPWVIRPRTGQALRFTGRGGETIFRRQVVHPGLPARPWLRPALEASRPDIIATFTRQLQGLATVTGGGHAGTPA